MVAARKVPGQGMQWLHHCPDAVRPSGPGNSRTAAVMRMTRPNRLTKWEIRKTLPEILGLNITLVRRSYNLLCTCQD